jgi:hypothetical protein
LIVRTPFRIPFKLRVAFSLEKGLGGVFFIRE